MGRRKLPRNPYTMRLLGSGSYGPALPPASGTPYWAFCSPRTLWTTNAKSRTTPAAIGIAHETSASIERVTLQSDPPAPAPNTMLEACAMS